MGCRHLDFSCTDWHHQRHAQRDISGENVMLTVHHLNNSRSQRVLWLLDELGVPYEIVRYNVSRT